MRKVKIINLTNYDDLILFAEKTTINQYESVKHAST